MERCGGLWLVAVVKSISERRRELNSRDVDLLSTFLATLYFVFSSFGYIHILELCPVVKIHPRY